MTSNTLPMAELSLPRWEFTEYMRNAGKSPDCLDAANEHIARLERFLRGEDGGKFYANQFAMLGAALRARDESESTEAPLEVLIANLLERLMDNELPTPAQIEELAEKYSSDYGYMEDIARRVIASDPAAFGVAPKPQLVANPEEQEENTAAETPAWIDFELEPFEYRMEILDWNRRSEPEVEQIKDITEEEYMSLKRHLARLRGFAVAEPEVTANAA